MPTTPTLTLDSPVQMLAGVGPERSVLLARLEIHTVRDLLLHRPHRYEDRRHFISISALELKQPATVRGKVVAQGIKYFKQRTRSVFELVLDDGSARLHCRWWNLPFLEKFFHVGDEVMDFGKPNSLRPRTMDHPETEVLEPGEDASIHLDRIVPIYPLTDGLAQRTLRSLVWRALAQCEGEFVETAPGLTEIPERRFPSRANAVHMLHFPEAMDDTRIARDRLAFDEIFALQTELRKRRRALEANARALPCGGTNELMRPFLASLGFKLTGAQTRVLKEIRHDLAGAVPMRRLLQGDVGSGKTAVAACSALMALESGFNVALMAPTEILAEQHYRTFGRWLEPLGVRVEFRTGSRKASGAELGPQRPPKETAGCLFVGTHALITPAFDMDRLGLVVIDEQHKFGVVQREQLLRKGRYPHLLVMTATPIPRTLGLTVYGDLDVSVIDELPGNRGGIRTFVRSHAQLPKVHEFIRGQLRAGRQCYVVYARAEVADSEAGIKAATEELSRLQEVFAPHRVGLLHGRMHSREKDAVMEDFRANRLQVLLATSVIEVGVDVANATVMVIENAEQFGLAQLHQLRGRVGRGAQESFCILVASLKTDQAARRLRVMEETTDGFAIAEADLKQRGPGELLGGAQSGLPSFRFADLAEDRELVELARTRVALTTA